jgi:imidazolonepropionase-like amidohydrolase
MASEMKYVSRSQVENWIARRDRELMQSGYSKAKAEKFLQIRRTIIKALHDREQGLLAGTDPPQVFIVPGFSLHQEMESFIRAGLTTYEAMQTATVNPAKFFDRQGEFGEISEGASADLVLLADNPLTKLENYGSIQGVMYQGKWLSKEMIDAGLRRIENKYKEN